MTPKEGDPLVGGSSGGNQYQSTPVVSNVAGDGEDGSSGSGESNEQTTTFAQTILSLVKGYIGCGILSLPWAISQLGIPLGVISISVMAFWSSYNCWTVVKLKRYLERTVPIGNEEEDPEQLRTLKSDGMDQSSKGSSKNKDDETSEAGSEASTNVTYPDLGDWAYGKKFQSYVAACICTQQLAICTVYISFIGENLLAVLDFYDIPLVQSHWQKITVALPLVLSLSFLPSLKKLAPVVMAGTVLLLSGFVALGVVGDIKWEDRAESPPTINPPKAPLAVASILFSYEGICLVLPVESAMKQPQQFKRAFEYAMVLVAVLMALVACLSTMVFGDVTNGSITAFLLQLYKHDPSVTFWVMVANTAVSLSILLSYPLQLVPAAELMGPWLSQMEYCPCGGNANDKLPPDDEHDLAGFEPLPPLPEHQESLLDSPRPSRHENKSAGNIVLEVQNDDDIDDDAKSRSSVGMESVRSMATAIMPEMSMPGDSPMLRLFLVLLTYTIAVAVPNVENLISLAGAVAGSSTALLIPPILDLAWISHLEKEIAAGEFNHHNKNKSSYFWEKVRSWTLVFLGSIFAIYGTQSSIADIIRIYRDGES